MNSLLLENFDLKKRIIVDAFFYIYQVTEQVPTLFLVIADAAAA